MTDHAGSATLAGAGGLKGYSRRTSGSVWQYVAPMPHSHSGVGYGVVSDKLYVIGGHTETSNPAIRKAVLMYDPALNVWTTKTSAPTQVMDAHAHCVTLGNYIYIVGFYNGSGYDRTLLRYDTVGDTWASLAQVPVADWTPGVVWYDPVNARIVYTVTNNSATSGQQYNIATDVWTSRSQPVFNFQTSALTHSNGKVYFLSGGFPPVWREYDPVLDTHTSKAAPPVSIGDIRMLLEFQGDVWAIGGYEELVHAYTPGTDTWRTMDDLYTSRYGSAVGVVDGRPIVAGGYDITVSEYQSSVEMFTNPGPSTAELTMTLPLLPMKVLQGSLELNLGLSSEVHVDPRQLNPGLLKIGVRPAGWTPPKYWEFLESVPFPDEADTNVLNFGNGAFTRPFQMDEAAFGSDGQYLYVGSGYWQPEPWGDGTEAERQWWSNRLYRFDADSETWTEMEPFPNKLGSEGGAGAVIDDKFYVVMGDSQAEVFGSTGVTPDPEFVDEPEMLQSLWIYDITGDTWTRGPQPPFAQSYGSACALDGKLYVLQGENAFWENGDAFYAFDPIAETWETLAAAPYGQDDYPTLWATTDRVWLTSYLDETNQPQIHSYDPVTDAWTDETPTFDTIGLPPLLSDNNLYFAASAPVKVTDDIYWIIGYDSTYEIDIARRIIWARDFRWPAPIEHEIWTNGGAFLYEGDLFMFGPWQSGTALQPVGMWVIRDAWTG